MYFIKQLLVFMLGVFIKMFQMIGRCLVMYDKLSLNYNWLNKPECAIVTFKINLGNEKNEYTYIIQTSIVFIKENSHNHRE